MKDGTGGFKPHGNSILISKTGSNTNDFGNFREKPQKNISSKLIFNEIKKHNHKNLFFLDNIENINPFLTNIVKRNDMVLTMGAGTIWRYGQKFYDYLNK